MLPIITITMYSMIEPLNEITMLIRYCSLTLSRIIVIYFSIQIVGVKYFIFGAGI